MLIKFLDEIINLMPVELATGMCTNDIVDTIGGDCVSFYLLYIVTKLFLNKFGEDLEYRTITTANIIR